MNEQKTELPIAEAMLCFSCKHWGSGHEMDRWNESQACQRITGSAPAQRLFLYDGGRLFTPPDFGCVLWESKEA
jgi:hypothetical protein